MMSVSVSGLVSTVFASSSTLLLLTWFSTRCCKFELPIGSALPPTIDRNLEEEEEEELLASSWRMLLLCY